MVPLVAAIRLISKQWKPSRETMQNPWVVRVAEQGEGM